MYGPRTGRTSGRTHSKPWRNHERHEDFAKSRVALPVYASKAEFTDLLQNNQVVIVVGETGSGKTTQLPQYAVEMGFKAVACTQPRRVAAITVSQRVAKEMGVRWGAEVGYVVRFEDYTSPSTCLKYMTDGILLQECMSHPDFDQYEVVFLDEVHERTLATDILLGLLKLTLGRGSHLKVVIMSATFDCIQFSEFFSGAPTLRISGRTHPVDILSVQSDVADYLEEIISTVFHILLYEGDQGHILAFLTGEEEIEQACTVLQTDRRFAAARNVMALPLYSALDPQAQQRVFDSSAGLRKVIFATNIAETSVTIPGVVYVIDCGYSKQKLYLPGPRVETLLVQPISKASARQRAGRAGRTRPGKCYRLYSPEAFEELSDTTAPEILRTNVAQVILQLSKLGVSNILDFPFVDPPPVDATIRSLEELQAIGALNIGLSITDLGRQMSQFPIDPLLAATLLQAHHEGCTKEIAAIIAMLSVPKLYLRTDRESSGFADRAQAVFKVKDSDHLSLLKIYNFYVQACTGDANAELDMRTLENGNPGGRYFCQKHRLQEKSIRQAARIHHQLLKIMQGLGLPTPGMTVYDYDNYGTSYAVRRALCRGLFVNIACLVDYEYRLPATGNVFKLHTSTSLKGLEEWVLFQEAVITDRAYLRTCSKVEKEWLREFMPGEAIKLLKQKATNDALKVILKDAFPD